MVTTTGRMLSSFFLPVAPTAQMRPRFSRFGGTFKAEAQKKHERELDECLRLYAPKSPVDAPVSVEMDCCMSIPASITKRRRAEMEGLFELPRRRDLDNMCKQLLDGMTRCGYWTDDDLVCEIHARKFYSANPGWLVSIWECVLHG